MPVSVADFLLPEDHTALGAGLGASVVTDHIAVVALFTGAEDAVPAPDELAPCAPGAGCRGACAAGTGNRSGASGAGSRPLTAGAGSRPRATGAAGCFRPAVAA